MPRCDGVEIRRHDRYYMKIAEAVRGSETSTSEPLPGTPAAVDEVGQFPDPSRG